MPKGFSGPGWHYGPDDEKVEGFVDGTAWQPPDVEDHFDSWGTPHPGQLQNCSPCKTAREIPGA
ncbi:hypothetical protein AB0E08_07600 [Streptomyces sp. NPDC048281]|uniref:hypothetical protein n=1 Tax=Streptomyces sp. NPDC048281 TaxID=3154715 RepID=UPI00341C638A